MPNEPVLRCSSSCTKASVRSRCGRIFPIACVQAAGCRGLVYSRPGYGQSTPRAVTEFWRPDFMHRQALELLPALLERLGHAATPIWLFGHSDGGSIALILAARQPARVAGLVVLAPHIMVEPLSVESIAKARDTYLGTDLRSDWRATMPTPIRRSGAGTTSGWRPNSATGASRTSWHRSVARCSRSRASTTSTAHSSRSAASHGAPRRCRRWSWPTAGIHRIAISRIG